MFTGIVEELGSIAARDDQRLRIAASKILEDVHLGDSIAVSGGCLTVEKLLAWHTAPAQGASS